MNWETRVFFRLPAAKDNQVDSFPSLTDPRVIEILNRFIVVGQKLSVLSGNDNPEERTDNYLVVGGRYGGYVGVKLRGGGGGGSSGRKLEVKTCISHDPVIIDTQRERGKATEGVEDHKRTSKIPPLAAWDKVTTRLTDNDGPLEDNLSTIRDLIRKGGGSSGSKIGKYAANNLVTMEGDGTDKKLVQVVLKKQRLQDYLYSLDVAFEETDLDVSLLKNDNNDNVVGKWRSWAFEGGSYKVLESIANNWVSVFDEILKSTTTTAKEGDATTGTVTTTTTKSQQKKEFLRESFRVASYPEFVQFIYLEQTQQQGGEQKR